MKTKYFGMVKVPEERIITFPSGLFGFEKQTRYVLLGFAEDHLDTGDDWLLCLQSAEDPELALMVLNPYYICADYNPYQMPEKHLSEIKLGQETKHTVCCIAVIRDKFEESTVNLKCPIIFNLENRLAKQFILEDSDYSMRQPMVPKEG
ncbi:flagellar assembly protein FliW [Aminipila butyrica]|uniref:Flagellar assembly factor FliW n=1 Tax=Aminipila butyrica TaxID=433296 RepID=A0A858BRA0_9FIRM|nr:flagellar assembly protein FliW [Aminipila butyrica]QIB68393.1 flagellar assembly protein FliW [Aminipila butyrica]